MKSSKLVYLAAAILCFGLVIIREMDGAQETNPAAVRQSILGAQPAYTLFDAKERLGVNYAKHGHAFTEEDWTAMMDFFDKHLRGKKIDRTFE